MSSHSQRSFHLISPFHSFPGPDRVHAVASEAGRGQRRRLHRPAGHHLRRLHERQEPLRGAQFQHWSRLRKSELEVPKRESSYLTIVTL